MIIYFTKQTFDYYGVKDPSEWTNHAVKLMHEKTYEAESGNKMHEWGGKMFVFNGMNFIQMSHFASKFTLVLPDVAYDDFTYIGDMMAEYMLDIYSGNIGMTSLLNRFFKDHPFVTFSRLTDRGVITVLNHMQSRYLDDGYTLLDYLEGNVLQSKKLNRDMNINYVMRYKKDDSKRQIYDYYHPAEKFEQLLKAEYMK